METNGGFNVEIFGRARTNVEVLTEKSFSQVYANMHLESHAAATGLRSDLFKKELASTTGTFLKYAKTDSTSFFIDYSLKQVRTVSPAITFIRVGTIIVINGAAVIPAIAQAKLTDTNTEIWQDDGDGVAQADEFSNIEFTADLVVTAGKFAIGTEYTIVTPGTTDFTLIGAADNDIGTQFTATGVGTGTGKALDTTVRFSTTSGTNGFDTGFVRFDGLEANILKLETYTDVIVTPAGAPIIGHSETIDKTQFHVYDIYGRGYSIDVKKDDNGDDKTGTILSFDGATLVVNQEVLFNDASDTNKQLIAVEKAGTSDIEFMLYDNKGGPGDTSLTISNRVLYTGLGHTFVNNDTVHVLEVPLQLVRNNDEDLENLL